MDCKSLAIVISCSSPNKSLVSPAGFAASATPYVPAGFAASATPYVVACY
jgi:hypothetical protein